MFLPYLPEFEVEQKAMKKPWTVRIVEALGWAYVALYAGGSIFAFCVIYSDTGFVDAALVSGVFLLPQLCLPIGMVVALREGRRVWFIWPHAVLVALIAFVCIFLSQLWFVTAVAIVLIAVPIALGGNGDCPQMKRGLCCYSCAL